MRYKLEDIEQQIIDTLQGDTNLAGVNIRTHVGDIKLSTFLDPQSLEGFIHLLPFIFVQYQGRIYTMSDTKRETYVHELTFRFYVGAKSLRVLREAQASAYSMLRSVFDDIHGHWIASAALSLAPNLSMLGGKLITGATNTTPITVTETAHGRATGDGVMIRDVGGNTAANNTTVNPYWPIVVLTPNTYNLTGSVGNGAYTAGGKAIAAQTASGFNWQSPFMEATGKDERLIVNLPQIVVYNTDYIVKVVA